jgi:myo-inositol-1(or 4)-monophosphatase
LENLMTETFSVTAALLDELVAATRETGELILARPRPMPARTMAEFRRNFAEVEHAAEPGLRARLAAIRPGVEWTDEFDIDLVAGEQRWLADITDGAIQYLQGLPQWCVSVTLLHDRQAVAAVLHNPVSAETYSAAAGLGAFRDGEPITPSVKTDLAIALAATSQPPFVATQPAAVAAAGPALSAALPAVGAVRNFGPTSWQVAEVGGGRLDAFWQFGRDEGNLLGATLIAREAGATVTDVAGEPWRPGSDSVLVAAPALHGELRGLLAG